MSAMRDPDRTVTAGPDDPDENDRTPGALHRAHAPAARPSGNRTDAPESGAGDPPLSCWATPLFRARDHRRQRAHRSIHGDTFLPHARESPCQPLAPTQGGAQSSTSQNFSVKYFSAPSGNMVTITPRSNRRATSSVAASAAPDEIPASNPSSRASRR